MQESRPHRKGETRMTKERLIAEIRQAQEARKSETPEQIRDLNASSDCAEDLLAAAANLIETRLQTTQERLIASIEARYAEVEATPLNARSTDAGKENSPISAGTPIVREISEPDLDLTPILDRLDAIEQRLQALSEAAPSTTPSELLERLQHLAEQVELSSPAAEPFAPLLHSSLQPIDARLTEIEQRLAGALEDRSNTENVSGTAAGDQADLSSLSTRLPQIEAKLTDLWEAITSTSSVEPTQKEISSLKRDFSLLVRTLNDHLEESRQRSDQLESSIDQMKQSILALAKESDFDLP